MRNRMLSRRRPSDLMMRMERDENPFDVLHREIDELFDSYYRGIGRHGRWNELESGFEVSETDEEICVKAEMPGIEEKDIEITLDENVLTIHGERHEEREEKRRNYQFSEMHHGSFHRSFPLRVAVDRSQASAQFKRGVLTLTLPKTERAKAERKRIPISTD